MGVTGLWKLIEGAGKEVSLESLEGKVFSVDASILLNQAIKGMKDQPNAHLHVLFLRICKLLTYQIKPIFVYDGTTPALKKQTLAARQKNREEAAAKALDVSEKLRQKKIQQLAVDKTLGKKSTEIVLPSEKSDIFELPPLPQPHVLDENNEDNELDIHEILYAQDFDVSQVDINSDGFRNLPAEYQHEILEEVREYNKHNLPSNYSHKELRSSHDFSDFQLSKIVKNNQITQKIETLRKVMIGSMSDQRSTNCQSVTAHKIASEDQTHSLLIKKLPNPIQPISKPDLTKPNPTSVHYETKPETKKTPVYFRDRKRRVQEKVCLDEPLLSSDEEHDVEVVPKKKVPQEIGTETPSTSRSLQDSSPTLPNSEIPNGSNIEESVEMLEVSGKSAEKSNMVDAQSAFTLLTSEQTCREEPGEKSVEKTLTYPEDATSGIKHLSQTGKEEITNEKFADFPPSASSESGETYVETTSAGVMMSQHSEHEVESVDLREDSSNGDRATLNVVEVINVDNSDLPSPRDQKPLSMETELTNEEQTTSVQETTSGEKKTISTENGKKAILEEILAFKQKIRNPSDEVETVLEVEEKEPEPENKETPNRPGQYLQQCRRTIYDEPNVAAYVDEGGLEFSPPPSDFVFNTEADIFEFDRELNIEATGLTQELRHQDAISNLVTKQMIDDSLELLRLFGVPYVISPSEAEAQCATLNQLGMCDGIITDDSDVWLFGGLVILKNFFQMDRHVLRYRLTDIEALYGLDRRKLIAIALVSGSDYTNGIMGGGPVTAMEIISEFDRQDGLSAMSKFAEFISAVKANNNMLPASDGNNVMRTKLSKVLALPEAFPNQVVIDAYLKPAVDESTETFEWGKPDLDLLRKYAHSKLGWPKKKVDDLVQPVLKRLNSPNKQATLDKYMSVRHTSIIASRELQSKRVKAAISKILSSNEPQTSHTVPSTIPDSKIKNSQSLNVKPHNKKVSMNNKTAPKPKRGQGAKNKSAKPIQKQPIKVSRQIINQVDLSDDSDSD